MENKWSSPEASPDTALGSTYKIWWAESLGRSVQKEQPRHSSRFRRTEDLWLVPAGMGTRWFFPVSGGEPQPIPGVQTDERIAGFAADGKSVFVYNFAGLPCLITRIDLATGKRAVWKQLVPADAAGVDAIGGIGMTPDAKSYVYSYPRTLSDLYVVEGLK
jgi:hypothetical protein